MTIMDGVVICFINIKKLTDSSGFVKLTSTPYPHADNDITNTSPNASIIFAGILSVNEESRDVNNDDTVPIGNDEDNTKQDTLTSGRNNYYDLLCLKKKVPYG